MKKLRRKLNQSGSFRSNSRGRSFLWRARQWRTIEFAEHVCSETSILRVGDDETKCDITKVAAIVLLQPFFLRLSLLDGQQKGSTIFGIGTDSAVVLENIRPRVFITSAEQGSLFSSVSIGITAFSSSLEHDDARQKNGTR